MPELPEVETLVRGLREVLIGREIHSLEIRKSTSPMWHGKPHAELLGSHVMSISRAGKLLVLSFDHNLTLLIHLKMTGQLIFENPKGEMLGGGHPDDQFMAHQPSKYTYIIFSFSDGSQLFFNDMRQFGYAQLIDAKALAAHRHMATLGVEPLSTAFTSNFLYQTLQKRPKTTVKQVLLDQTAIAGLGNIYTDESLFDARILPSRRAASITKDEAAMLHKSIIKILEVGIRYGGTSYKDYVHHNGSRGTMQDHLCVYRRQGMPCKRCSTTIERIIIGGRGTHFCPNCQK